jgi:hypothetical protein
MAVGRLVAYGSPVELKTRLAPGYFLTLSRSPEAAAAAAAAASASSAALASLAAATDGDADAAAAAAAAGDDTAAPLVALVAGCVPGAVLLRRCGGRAGKAGQRARRPRQRQGGRDRDVAVAAADLALQAGTALRKQRLALPAGCVRPPSMSCAAARVV